MDSSNSHLARASTRQAIGINQDDALGGNSNNIHERYYLQASTSSDEVHSFKNLLSAPVESNFCDSSQRLIGEPPRKSKRISQRNKRIMTDSPSHELSSPSKKQKAMPEGRFLDRLAQEETSFSIDHFIKTEEDSSPTSIASGVPSLDEPCDPVTTAVAGNADKTHSRFWPVEGISFMETIEYETMPRKEGGEKIIVLEEDLEFPVEWADTPIEYSDLSRSLRKKVRAAVIAADKAMLSDLVSEVGKQLSAKWQDRFVSCCVRTEIDTLASQTPFMASWRSTIENYADLSPCLQTEVKKTLMEEKTKFRHLEPLE